MWTFLKSNRLSVVMLLCVVIGGICGLVFGDAAHVVAPVGEIFLNLVFVLVVPLVFFSIAASVCKLKQSGMVGRVFGYVVAVFLATSIIAGVLAYFGCLAFNPLGSPDNIAVPQGQDIAAVSRDLAQSVVASLTVSDFNMILSKSNLLPLIIFALLFGYATAACGKKGETVATILESGSQVCMKVMDMLMYLAPVGLGCYFADMVASLGGQILSGYARTLLLYCILSVVLFALIQPLYIFMFRGSNGLKSYWANILPPSITSFASASSAAGIPSGINASRNMGVSAEIAEAVVPLGANIHKDGSVLGSVIKVIFLMTLFGQPLTGFGAALSVIGIAIVSSLVIGAIPSGGLTGELLVCSLLGLDPSTAGLIIVIGTIVDMPASMMNISCNVTAAALIDALASRRSHKTSSSLTES